MRTAVAAGAVTATFLAASLCSAGASVVEAGTLTTVTIDAPVFDINLSNAGGCDPTGCVGDFTRDNDATDESSRWSCKPDLSASLVCSITYTFEDSLTLVGLAVALFRGDETVRTMEIYLDDELITTWSSSGTTTDLEGIDFDAVGETVELRGVLADSEWLSILEVEIFVVTADDGSTPSPVSPSTPAPSLTPTPTNIDAPPEGELQPVGLIPLAYGDGTVLEAFYAKDGDFSTEWTCTGDSTSGCGLSFRLDYYRHIKQINIAASDGDDGAVDIMITGRNPNFDAGENFEVTVSSSGSTDGFETFDFDFLTTTIEIDSLFTSTGQTLTISEIEFVEEVQEGFVPVTSFSPPDVDQLPVTGGFAFMSESADTLGEDIFFSFAFFAEIMAVELQFPVGDTYMFDVQLVIEGEDATVEISGFESADVTGWQNFDVSQSRSTGQIVTDVRIVMQGTGSGATGFSLLDARFAGELVANPTDVLTVGSVRIERWTGGRYPDYVGSGTGDQQVIQAAICGVKKASFDGVDCVGEDPDATGTVELSMGSYYIDGNIFLKSGVHLEGQYSIDDAPSVTRFILEEGAAGNTDVEAMVVFDGVTNAIVEDLFISGLYVPPTSTADPAVAGLGSTGISVTNSEDIICTDIWVTNMDGDAVVLQDSINVNVDAGRYDEEFRPSAIAESRGTGLVVDNCEKVWVRRHAMYNNGEAGIHIVGSSNFTFEATIASALTEGDGLVGSLDGQQPIEIIVESSALVTFQDMKVVSNNEPVITVSADSSSVSCNNCGFSSVEAGTCVIQTEDPTVVSAVDDELTLDGTCYVKV